MSIGKIGLWVLFLVLAPVLSAPVLDLTSPVNGTAYSDNDVSFVYSVNSTGADYVNVILEYDGYNSTEEPIEVNLTRNRVLQNLNMGEHSIIFYIEENDILYMSQPVEFVVLEPLSRCGKWNNSFEFTEPHLPSIGYYNSEYSLDIKYSSPDIGCYVTVYSPQCEIVDYWIPREGKKLALEYLDAQLYTEGDGRLRHQFYINPAEYPLSTGNVYTVLISCEGDTYVKEFSVTDAPIRGVLTSLGRVYQNAEDYATIVIFVCVPIFVFVWYLISLEAMVYSVIIVMSAMLAGGLSQPVIYVVTALVIYMALKKEVFIPKKRT